MEALSGLHRMTATIPATLHPVFVPKRCPVPAEGALGSQRSVEWPARLSCRIPHPRLLRETHGPRRAGSHARGPRHGQAPEPQAASAGVGGWG